jgi:triacylglycerol lipase
MRFLTANLLSFFVVGGFLVLASFVRLQLVRPEKWSLRLGLLSLLLAAIGTWQVLVSPPGQVNTVVEPTPVRPPAPASTAIQRLRMDWDSEGSADWFAADTLAALSEIAYEPPYFAEKSFNALGFKQVIAVVKGSMIGYVISGDNVTVVVFRGTDFEEVSDWLANVGRSAVQTEHGQAHKGFYNAYQSMKPQVDAILRDRNTEHLWVTGHSLGGALALFCAYDLIEGEQRKVDGLMTFGQPLVAHRDLAEYVNSLLVHRYVRFVNGDDVVAKVPPSHVPCGSLVWFTETGLRRWFVRPKLHAGAAGDPSDPKQPPLGDATKQADIRPLTEAEFDALQAKLKRENAAKERLPEGTPTDYQAASSAVDDHSMNGYRRKIRQLLGIEGQ